MRVSVSLETDRGERAFRRRRSGVRFAPPEAAVGQEFD
jgi:hypothetical protein